MDRSDHMEAFLDIVNTGKQVFGVLVLVLVLQTKAIRGFVITEKAPTRAFSWLKVATTAFTFKTLLRQYAKQALTLW